MKAIAELGYALGNERWVERPWYSGDSLEEITALALRDGLAARWGRELVGLNVFASKAGEIPVEDPSSGPVAELPRLTLGLSDAAPAPEPTRFADAPVPDVAWYRHESALGFSGLTGVHLQRCAAMAPDVAEDAAEELTFHTTHQGSVYPVAAIALPWVVQLLARPELHPRATLARGLVELLVAARGRSPTTAAIARAISILRPASFDADATRLVTREVEASAAVRAEARRLAPALRALGGDPVVGPILATVRSRR